MQRRPSNTILSLSWLALIACSSSATPDASLIDSPMMDGQADTETDAVEDNAVVILDGSATDAPADLSGDSELDATPDLNIPELNIPDMDIPRDCTAMDVMQVGLCRPIRGYYWNGGNCVLLSGCSCAGEDCVNVFPSSAVCDAAYEGCPRVRER